MRGSFQVAVTKDYLVFPAAHFITFPGHRCEPLHGHNYRVAVRLAGAVDEECWYVVDFAVVKKMMRDLCEELDHKVLLPTGNPQLAIEERGDAVHVAFDGAPRYVFPRAECVRLPIPNTTVEMLAQYLAGRVVAAFRAQGGAALSAVEVEVEENFGQSASYRETLA
ncbi:MAG TPA: 6-carboxytetrahydropterin synthase [Gemmatimonadaceae bacterium]|nr:6-carboxytetrahydropterin synthase [Gemmatimonadaceae bacterium]